MNSAPDAVKSCRKYNSPTESSLIFSEVDCTDTSQTIDFCNADIALDIMRSRSKRYLARRFELIMLNPLILMCVFSCV